MQAGKKVVDASLKPNERIARRRIITATLLNSYVISAPIKCCDLSRNGKILVTCSLKVVNIWGFPEFNLTHTFGKPTGVWAQYNITDCAIHPEMNVIAIARTDLKCIIFSLKKKQSQAILKGHRALIFQIKFTLDGFYLLSCSDDGTVKVWDPTTGALQHTFMRHDAGVHCFELNDKNPDRVITGTTNGHILAWDLKRMTCIDNIPSDPDWDSVISSTQANEGVWEDEYRNHTGPILYLKTSPNNRIMATCSRDHTCKLWDILSYSQDIDFIEHIRDRDFIDPNKCINCLDDRLELLLDLETEITEIKVGEPCLQQDYNSVLIHTLRHEGPVICAVFTGSSEMVVTSSLDCTLRIWSVITGILLFQINLPSPVTSLMEEGYHILACCENRLLVFQIDAVTVETLPMYWRRDDRKLFDVIEEEIIDKVKKPGIDIEEDTTQWDSLPLQKVKENVEELLQFKKLSNEEKQLVRQRIEEAMEAGEPMSKDEVDFILRTKGFGRDYRNFTAGDRMYNREELQQLLAQGLLDERFLYTVAEKFKNEIDSVALFHNLRKFNLQNRQAIRLMLSSNYDPHDVLSVLADRHSAENVYNLLKKGASIKEVMKKMGFKENEDSFSFFLSKRILSPTTKLKWEDIPDQMLGEAREDEEALLEDIESNFFSKNAKKTTIRGRILHFIPSEQIKLIKDIQNERDIKPIFLRKFIYGAGLLYPNFDVEDEHKDAKPRLPPKANPHVAVRFNERLPRTSAPRKRGGGRLIVQPQAPVPPTRLFEVGRTQLHSSSRTLFKPERYFQTRGLNVKFDNENAQGKRTSVYVEPIYLRRQGKNDIQGQLVVGRQTGMADEVLNDTYEIDE